jgi:hypothetical protein
MRGKIIVHYAKADRLEAGGFNPVCGKSILTCHFALQAGSFLTKLCEYLQEFNPSGIRYWLSPIRIITLSYTQHSSHGPSHTYPLSNTQRCLTTDSTLLMPVNNNSVQWWLASRASLLRGVAVGLVWRCWLGVLISDFGVWVKEIYLTMCGFRKARMAYCSVCGSASRWLLRNRKTNLK